MKKIVILLFLIIIIISGGVIFFVRKTDKNSLYMQIATIKTNFGDIKIEFYENDAPKTVKNFIDLANKGFYNGIIFHRVVKNFVIQAGDPFCNITQSADTGICGTGGPGYQFEDELNPNTDAYKNGYKKGAVAMANSGPNTNGSQFFIMIQDVALPNNYAIFGKVIEGQDIADKIGLLPVNQNDRPIQPAIIEKIEIPL